MRPSVLTQRCVSADSPAARSPRPATKVASELASRLSENNAAANVSPSRPGRPGRQSRSASGTLVIIGKVGPCGSNQ